MSEVETFGCGVPSLKFDDALNIIGGD